MKIGEVTIRLFGILLVSIFFYACSSSNLPKRELVRCVNSNIDKKSFISQKRIECIDKYSIISDLDLKIKWREGVIIHSGDTLIVVPLELRPTRSFDVELFNKKFLVIGERGYDYATFYHHPLNSLLIYDLENKNLYDVQFIKPIYLVPQLQYIKNKKQLTKPIQSRKENSFIDFDYDPRLDDTTVQGLFSLKSISVIDNLVSLEEMYGARVITQSLLKL